MTRGDDSPDETASLAPTLERRDAIADAIADAIQAWHLGRLLPVERPPAPPPRRGGS